MKKKDGQINKMISEIAQFYSSLDSLLSTENSNADYQNFSFGNRTLEIIVEEGMSGFIPFKSLQFETIPNKKKVKLTLLNRKSFEKILFPQDLKFGPYDSVLNCQSEGWLITYSRTENSVLALRIRDSKSLYFPGHFLKPRVKAEFCRPLIHWLSILDGNFVIHAGCIAYGDSACLISGAGNMGKTTLTQMCISDGMEFLGDNVIEIVKTGEIFHAFAIYGSFKVRENNFALNMFQSETPEHDYEAGKDIYLIANNSNFNFTIYPKKISTILRLDRQKNGEIKSDLKNDAGFFIAPNTIGQFPFFEDEVLSRVFELVKKVPTFTSGFLDPKDAVPRIKELIK
jgi:hypothetical protein